MVKIVLRFPAKVAQEAKIIIAVVRINDMLRIANCHLKRYDSKTNKIWSKLSRLYTQS